MKRLVLFAVPLLFTLAACGNDDPLYPTGNTGTTNTQSTTGGTTGTTGTTGGSNLCGTGSSSIGYTAFAATVFNGSCVTNCHSPTGTYSSLPLDTYANAKGFTANAFGVLNNGMPPSGYTPLTANQICILQDWVNQGYPQ